MPIQAFLDNLERKTFFGAKPWWVTFKISFAIIFVTTTNDSFIFKKLNRTLNKIVFNID